MQRIVLQSVGGSLDWTSRIEIRYQRFPAQGTLGFRKVFPDFSSVMVSDRLTSAEVTEIARAIEGARLSGSSHYQSANPDPDRTIWRLTGWPGGRSGPSATSWVHPNRVGVRVPLTLSRCIQKIQNLAHRVEQRRDPFAALCRRSSHRDTNRDGDEELVHVTAMDLHSTPRPGSPLVLVLVDPRLVQPIAGRRDLGINAALRRYSLDLQRSGYSPRLVLTRLYSGSRHQDGRTLLALREFFRTVRHHYPSFEGAILVGSFPEAVLVRTCHWAKESAITIGGVAYENARYMQSIPKVVAARSDLVLSDLDGNWGRVYTQESTPLRSFLGLWSYPGPARSGWYRNYELETKTFEDFFHIDDAGFRMPHSWRDWKYFEFQEESNLECTPDDRAQPNPIARPEIRISRIDARHVALSPQASIRGVGGEGLLDCGGQPRRVGRRRASDVSLSGIWRQDPVLERQLLIEFFDRNHRYRRGTYHRSFRPAAIGYEFSAQMSKARSAHRDWGRFRMAGYDIGKTRTSDGASILEYVQWLKRPAVLRTVRAHSNQLLSQFGPTTAAALRREIGTPWDWKWDGRDLVPSFSRIASNGAESPKGTAGFSLYRSLWSNRTLPEQASFYFHTGCHVITPAAYRSRPYNHPDYGAKNGAESLLFYGKGLALIGRSKVFNDEPKGFFGQLGRDRTFGQAAAHYAAVDSGDATIHTVRRKSSYFWSVLGDWTLHLRRFGD